MANTKNAKKAARQAAKKRLHNRYYAKTTRNAIKNILGLESNDDQKTKLGSVVSLIDRLAKKNVIHKNKASNLKSKLMRKVLVKAA
jgi:small subunit ribosomal protein S20